MKRQTFTEKDASKLVPKGEGKGQRFIKNNQYFTISIYAGFVVLFSAVIFKCIIDFDKTKAWFGQTVSMLGPFLLGALMAYVLNPMVHMFYQGIDWILKKLGRSIKHSVHTVISILITYLIVIGFVVTAIVYVVPAVTSNIIDFVDYLPTAYKTIIEFLNYLAERFPMLAETGVVQAVKDIMPDMVSTLQGLAGVVPTVYSIFIYITGWVVNLLIAIIVSVYMLYDKRRIMRSSWKVLYAFVPEKYMPLCKEIFAECNRIFRNFVVGKFIDSLIIGVLCFILMNIFRLPYGLLISLIVGVTNMIPYFGPFIGAIPGILIILFIKPIQALGFAFMILCLQQFDGLILGPKILGNSTGMKPLWIIFAITIGGKLAGVAGMFLGVPLVAFLNYLLDLYLKYRLEKRHISESEVDGVLSDMELDD